MAAAAYFETVQKIYIAFYQRPADPAGLKYWAEQIDLAGGNPNAVITAFGTQPESIALYGEVTAANIGTVLDKIYQAAFSRTPAEAEKAYWTEQFNAGGITASSMALAVVLGAQNADAASVANKLTVANEFTAQVDGNALSSADFGVAPFAVTYVGDADADAARAILKPVTGDTATILTPAQITEQIKATIAEPSDPINSVTQALTTGVDTLVGGVAGDVFTGVASALTAENTLNALDQIDGGAGVDTLKVDLKSNFTGFTGTGKLANVENIELTNSGTIGRSFDATGVTGAAKYVLNAGTADISLSNLAAAGITVDVVGQKAGTATIGFTTKAVEGTADALTVGVNGVGTAAVKDAAGAVTTAAKYVTVAASGIEALTVNATGDNLVNLATAATKTITAAGTGSLTVEAVGAVTSFDASGVKGAVTANLTGADVGLLATVKGGEGNDVITVDLGDLTANATVSGGAGTNTLKLSGAGTVQPTLSQFQTVELNGITGDSTISAKNVSDLATLAVKGTALASVVTVAGLNTSALTVLTEGAQGGTIQLTSPTVLTYNTTATAADTAAKTQKAVATVITANEATNATINVGAYTTQTGDITVNKATAVTLNVATGKSTATPPVELTSFDANLTANAAQSIIVKADGLLGVTANKTLTAGAATLLDVTAAAGGDLAFATVKAQQVNITAGAALDIQGSTFTAAEQVTIAANAGYTNGTAVNLGKISTLNLSGTGTAATKLSQVKLGTLGSTTDITNAITVTATGLKGGAEVGTIETKGGNVTLTATEMTGHFKAGTIGAGANKVGNVTVNAAALGSTEVGAISTVAGATVQINATGLLGKNTADANNALKVGAVLVATEAVTGGNKNTGTISVTVDGSNPFNLGALQAKTVTVDASNFLADTVGATKGILGIITGQTVTVKGGSLASNTITIDAMKDAVETAAAITVTGGLGNDTLNIDTTADILVDDAVTISFTGATQLVAGSDKIVFADNANLTHASSKLTLSGVEVLDVATGKAVVVKAADLSGAEFALGAAGGTLTLKGTDAADTIDASKINGGTTTAKFFINGGKAADTIKLSTDTADAQTVVVNVTSATGAYSTESSTTAYDKVSTFTAGKDKISILDTDGSAATFAVNTATNTGAATLGVVTAVSNTTGVISFTKGDGTTANALVAGSAEIDTLAEIVALVDAAFTDDGKVLGFQFNGNSYLFGQNGTADVLVELTGVTGVTNFTGFVA